MFTFYSFHRELRSHQGDVNSRQVKCVMDVIVEKGLSMWVLNSYALNICRFLCVLGATFYYKYLSFEVLSGVSSQLVCSFATAPQN